MTTSHRFGGRWTEEKLTVIETYLRIYLKALKKQSFTLTYIDAFAGSGTRSIENDEPTLVELEIFLAGSAYRALVLDPPFHRYTFIEKNARRHEQLEEMVNSSFPHMRDRVEVLRGDANAELREICKRRDWYNERAALFLDPYATEVEWSTIEAIAGTKAIDAWILFPVAAINRNLKPNGEMPESFARKLTRIFGTDQWRDALFARNPRHRNLFEDEVEETSTSLGIDKIGSFFVSRLQTIFAGVDPSPKVLTNSTKSPLFVLCFASANTKGAAIALRMADHSKRARP